MPPHPSYLHGARINQPQGSTLAQTFTMGRSAGDWRRAQSPIRTDCAAFRIKCDRCACNSTSILPSNRCLDPARAIHSAYKNAYLGHHPRRPKCVPLGWTQHRTP